MSLTGLLRENSQVKMLFSTLPPLGSIVKTAFGYKQIGEPVFIPRFGNANPAIVGMACDYWCRSFIQRVNKKEQEIEIPRQVLGGVATAAELGFINEDEVALLLQNIHLIWKMRSGYINHLKIDEDKYLKGCLILAHCENTMRNQIKPPEGYLTIQKDDFIDLKQMTTSIQDAPRLLQTKKSFLLNPTFGDYSRKVGGADADYIIGNMLVDIKTTKSDILQPQHIHQLLGYYLLSQYDTTFPCKIKQIGIFFTRYNKLDYIEIEDLAKLIKLNTFSSFFKEIVEGNTEIFNEENYNSLKEQIV
ncbi:hypothetical protein CN918_32445 [Priestia megaterium]|nr:hypothetical protein CN918_32445 [Priestia megaterium]